MNCKNCGAVIRYDPKTYSLICDSCGFSKVLPKPDETFAVEEKDFSSAVDNASRDWQTDLRTVTCKQCGTVTYNDPNQISGICPYCGSTTVLDNSELADSIAPSAVIPFRMSKEDIASKFYKWNKWAFWTPEKFRKGAILDDLKGVYVPYWTFDADSHSSYSGRFGITVTNGDDTSTKWHDGNGGFDLFIDDKIVCGSKRFVSYKKLKNIIIFNKDDLIPYTPEALLGFSAEKYTIGLEESWEIAKQELKKRMLNKACDNESADFYDKNKTQITTEYRNIKYRYILVPMWLSATRYKDKVYNVIASGIDGRGDAQRPISVAKIMIIILLLVGIFLLPVILGLIFQFIVIAYMN